MGSGYIVDKRHFRRQEWTGRLVMLLFLGGPLVYIVELEFGIW